MYLWCQKGTCWWVAHALPGADAKEALTCSLKLRSSSGLLPSMFGNRAVRACACQG